MAQTPALRVTSRGDQVEWTATGNTIAGDVVEIGSIPLVATQAITSGDVGTLASEGVFDVPKTTDVFAVGDAVYWNSSGSPYGGTGSSGAADNTTGNIMGVCVSNATNNSTYARVKLTAAKRTNTIAGSVTADDITGSDAAMGVTGKAGSSGAGGTVVVAGGAGDTNTAGGATSLVGGAGDGTADGGASSVTGGASGDGSSTNGGAIAIAGGTAVGAATGDGGAVTIAGGAGPLLGNVGGAVTILSGAGDGTNGTAGAVILDSSGTGSTKGAVTIGTNAASVTLGKMPRLPFASVAATGNVHNNSAAVAEGITLITASDNTKGVQLPTCVDGVWCVLINQNTAETVEVYPPTGKQINALGANNAITLVANASVVLFSEGANGYYGGLSAGIMS